jgi:hypothetical protein
MHESSRIAIDAGVLVLVQEYMQAWSPRPELAPRRRKLTTRIALGFEVDQHTQVDGFRVLDCRCGAPSRLLHGQLAAAIRQAYKEDRTITVVGLVEATARP